MAEERIFTIEKISDTVYLDDAGQAVNGFLVRVRLHQWDEVRELRVPDDQPETVEAAINQAIERREIIDDLGG